MKKLLLATAIAALSVSAANAAPTIYGKAFVAADYIDIDFDGRAISDNTSVNYGEDQVEINSHASRLGFKGSEALSANTDVIYQLEYGTSISGDNATFTNRDTFLGVNNKQFGEFRAGKNQSTLARIDNVVVNQGYWDNLGQTENESETISALNMADSNRLASSIIWTAPKYNGLPLQLSAMYSSNDVDGDNSDDAGFGVAMMFDQGTGFTAGVAYDKDQNINGDIVRGTATVDLAKFMAAPVTLGALYQVADYNGSSDKEKGFVISAAMGLTNFARPASIYAQYNNTTNLNGFGDSDSDQIVVGGKYFYKDNIIAHAYAGLNKADNVNYRYNTNIKDVFNDDIMAAARGDAEVLVIGTGLEYKF